MKKLLIILTMLLLTGCGKEKTMITYEEVKELDDYVIVDVREYAEYKKGHILDAVLIPVETIDENVELDKDKTIIVYCRSGNRSSEAASKLKDLGYTVYDLGSIDNWKGNIVEE